MRSSFSIGLGFTALALSVQAFAQAPRPNAAPPTAAQAGATPAVRATPMPTRSASPTPVPTVDGYVAMLDVDTSVSGLKEGGSSGPEAQALLGRLRASAHLQTKIYMAQDLSRQEVVSTDFVLPAGTVILHEAGAKFYVIADPKAQTYVVLDAEGVLKALEGGAGIVNSEYLAKVTHTAEKKVIGGATCRKSNVHVTYASSIPFENDKVLVQQTNDIEIWHTPQYASKALLDHFFFKFQRDKTGGVQKLMSAEIGFPMELSMTIPAPAERKGAGPAGALHMVVSDVREDKKLPAELFQMPPAGYKKVERSPFVVSANP
jgi:hypothetical protein